MNRLSALALTSLIGMATIAQTSTDSVGIKKMEAVTVKGTKKQVIYRLDRQKIDAQQVLTANGGTAADILETLPSIQTDADGEVTFRGSSEYLVYIDGKKSPLEGAEALRTIPASTIQNIELITTPGAKYQAQGEVGIISITTRKGYEEGLSGSVDLSGSTHRSWNATGRLEYQKRRNKWWGQMQAVRYRGVSEFEQEKTTIVTPYTITSHSDGERFRTERAIVGSLGWQHAFSDQHTLSIEVQTGEIKNQRGGDMDYDEQRWYDTHYDHTPYTAHDRYALTKRLVEMTLNYQWNINKRGDKLSVSSRNRHDWHSMEYTESNLLEMSGIRHEGTRGYEHEYHWDCDEAINYKLQYRPTGALETGYQYITYSEVGDYNVKAWDKPASQFKWLDDQHAPFNYRRQIHTLYAQAKDHFGAWEAEAGMRMDHVHDKMDISVANASRNKHRTDLFPSAHISYNTTNNGTFTLGYSKRVNRPGIWKLEPYITYEDYYTRMIGNPDINPEYIHSMEFSWRKAFKGGHSLNACIYQRWKKDEVDLIRRAYAPGITLDSIINAGNRNDTGIELSGTLKAIKWWTITLNGHMNHYNFTAHYDGCQDRDGWCWAMVLSNQFRLTGTTRLQMDSHIVGPHMLTQGRERSYCFFNLAVKQQLMNGRMTLGLSAKDFLHTAKYNNSRNTTDLISLTHVRPVYPTITISMSYRFNTQTKEKEDHTKLEHHYDFEGKDF